MFALRGILLIDTGMKAFLSTYLECSLGFTFVQLRAALMEDYDQIQGKIQRFLPFDIAVFVPLIRVRVKCIQVLGCDNLHRPLNVFLGHLHPSNAR